MLALFPLGVINMARALQEERAAEACANAISTAKVMGRDSMGNPTDLRFDVTMTPYFTAPPPPRALPTPPPNPGPSYPVYFDPIGTYNYGAATPLGMLVGGTAFTDQTIPRVNPLPAAYATGGFPTSIKWCCLLDDITFGVPLDGTPHPSGANLIQR